MQERERREAARLTLPAFYERFHKPHFLAGAKPRTFEAYQEGLWHWKNLTTDPPIGRIDVDTLAGFKNSLLDPKHFQPAARRERDQLLLFSDVREPDRYTPRAHGKATVNKHLRAVLAILNKAGRQGPKNRDALGVLEETPWVKPFKLPKRLPRAVSGETLARLYRAAGEEARYPLLGVRPGHWWQALILFACSAGFRRGGLLSLRWESIDWDAREVTMEADDDKCGEERRKPLTDLLIRHLMRIRTSDALVFPWPHCHKTWYRQWHRIQRAARIQAPVCFHDLKRTCGTMLGRLGSAWDVQHMLDHSQLSTSQAYVNPVHQLREVVDRLPFPAAFYADFPDLKRSG